MIQKYVLTKKQLALLASCSLQGILIDSGFQPGRVTIVFQGSSTEYCRKHNGPKILLVPDFMPFCLAESILEMSKNGWEISLELEEVD